MLGLLIERDLRSRFVGSLTGWLWLIVTPLMMLGVYAFVFGVIFQARVPAGLDTPFWAWLAVALWPWLAFSEALQRGASSIQQNAGLLTKVVVPRQLFVTSSVTSTFLLHALGYVAVLLAVHFLGSPLHWLGLFHLILVLLALYLLGLGLGYLLAALQVFLRDIEQILPVFLLFWFFLTPIIYAAELMPPAMQWLLEFNPMSWWVEEIRVILFTGKPLPGIETALMMGGAVLTLALGRRVFERLAPHFEDFL
jgi:ABC-type polysaccharide/polyol phosphate export permease